MVSKTKNSEVVYDAIVKLHNISIDDLKNGRVKKGSLFLYSPTVQNLSKITQMSIEELINFKDSYGNTILHITCNMILYQTQDLVRDLLKHGANPNAQNNIGRTPLMGAVCQSVTKDGMENVAILLNHPDIDVNIRENINNRSVLMLLLSMVEKFYRAAPLYKSIYKAIYSILMHPKISISAGDINNHNLFEAGPAQIGQTCYLIKEGENKQPDTEQLIMYVYKVDDIEFFYSMAKRMIELGIDPNSINAEVTKHICPLRIKYMKDLFTKKTRTEQKKT